MLAVFDGSMGLGGADIVAKFFAYACRGFASVPISSFSSNSCFIGGTLVAAILLRAATMFIRLMGALFNWLFE